MNFIEQNSLVFSKKEYELNIQSYMKHFYENYFQIKQTVFLRYFWQLCFYTE